MQFEHFKQSAARMLSEHGATILTAGGVIGSVTTAVLTGRASFKASELIHEAEVQYANDHDDVGRMDTADKVKLVWPHYVPPVLIGTATVGSIVGANMVSARKAAALAAAYALTDERFAEYRAKVSNKLTGPKQQQIRDEIAQDRVNANPPSGQVVIVSGNDVLCFDAFSGRYLQSSVEKINKAVQRVNAEIFHHQYASLSFFYEEIGLDPTGYSETVGWNNINTPAIEVAFSATTTSDDRPCIVFEFSEPPRAEYTKLY